MARASITDILSAPVMRTTVNNVLGRQPYEIVERPGAYVLALEKEPADHCKRIIVLKPNGFTSNSLAELSSHPEAGEATVEIKGAARPMNKGYFPIKNCVEFAYRDKDGVKIRPDYPYAAARNAIRELKTSRTRFKVVRRNYHGFYHNLVNLTDEWLVIVLDKKLNLAKQINYSLIEGVGKKQRGVLRCLADGVMSNGDGIFKSDPDVVERVCSMNPHTSLPALITLLNVEEKGKHEQCTVFAIILKIAKRHPELARGLLEKAEEDRTAPSYYLRELIKKVKGYPE
jgi:hypothetical protein